ncbi:MAG: hypothetical protein A49_19940 [Methyloceanibacter sp.]|nr:MAG: hypothetical protein A49_19940 [Methyloceanibacter sp.]
MLSKALCDVFRLVTNGAVAINQVGIDVRKKRILRPQRKEYRSTSEKGFDVAFVIPRNQMQVSICEPAFTTGPFQKWSDPCVGRVAAAN